MHLLSIVIPVYNEAGTVDSIIKRVQSVSLPFDKEIIVVDDCSTDGTQAILAELASDNIRIFYHERNQGKGAALRTGLAETRGDIVIVQDADLEYDPDEYPRLLKPIVDGKADVVYGSRFIGGGEHRVLFFWHMVGNKLLTLLSNMLTNLTLTDMETCYKVFKREVLDSITIEENRFGFEPEITAKIAKLNIRIYEVGISYFGRNYTEGKKIGWKDGVSTLRCIIKYNLFRGKKVTRGDGLLEGYLARKRADVVNSLIPDKQRDGSILDIGCGSHPLYLLSSGFKVKYGVDKISSEKNYYDPYYCSEIIVKAVDIEIMTDLPFSDNEMNAVVMLAVVEHIEPSKVGSIFKAAFRVLKPGGLFIITTPTAAGNAALSLMSLLGLVSPEEIDEHKDVYDNDKLSALLASAGFAPSKMQSGKFELFMNQWMVAEK